MKLMITRFKNIKDGTIGKFELFQNEKSILKGYTLEPMGADEVRRGLDRRIPVGVYNVAWHKSPRFKMTLPLLFNESVSRERHILIHAGNYPKDTEGCILLGSEYNNQGIFNSKATLSKFLEITKGGNFRVEIENRLQTKNL